MSVHLPRHWSVLTLLLGNLSRTCSSAFMGTQQSPSLISLRYLRTLVLYIKKKDNLTGKQEHPKTVLQQLQAISSVGRGANEVFLL